MKRAVVLLSGGLDSATTLFYAKKSGYKIFALIFDYGQRHKKEIKQAKKIAQSCRCDYHVLKIRLPWKGSALLDGKVSLPSNRPLEKIAKAGIPATYVPARNIIFLSFAASYAEAVGAKAVFIGANARDYSGYPDCRSPRAVPAALVARADPVAAARRTAAAVRAQRAVFTQATHRITAGGA